MKRISLCIWLCIIKLWSTLHKNCFIRGSNVLIEKVEITSNSIMDDGSPNMRVIRYNIDNDIPPKNKTFIETTMKDIEDLSCVRFRHVPSTSNSIILFKQATTSSGCTVDKSMLGVIYIMLGGTLCYAETMLKKLLLKALGLTPPHKRIDRDIYVQIFWENIIGEMTEFEKELQTPLHPDIPYDFQSILHVQKIHQADHSLGRYSIESIQDENKELGSLDISFIDVVTLNIIYHCQDNNSEHTWTNWSQWSLCLIDQGTCVSIRSRLCKREKCIGEKKEKRKCDKCEGVWSRWTNWGACEGNYLIGTQSRQRSCNGLNRNMANCVGTNNQTKRCVGKLSEPYNETFESVVYQWKDESEHPRYMFIRTQPLKRASKSTPSVDFQGTRTGYFIGAFASSPAKKNDKAILKSLSYMTNVDEACFMFWFHMYSKEETSLVLYFEEEGSNVSKEIWKCEENNGNVWVPVAVNINNKNNNNNNYNKYYLKFIATRGKGSSSDIGLDNFLWVPESCPAFYQRQFTENGGKNDQPTQGFVSDDKEENLSALDKVGDVNKKADILDRLTEGDIPIEDNVRKSFVQNEYKYLWREKRIPVLISPDFNENAKKMIRDIIKRLNEVSCVNIFETTEPVAESETWLSVVNKAGCWSGVGKKFHRGPQELSLEHPACFTRQIVFHEFLHSLGFYHTQHRGDRDNYVDVFYENILAGKSHELNLPFGFIGDDLQLPYDYLSNMQYNTQWLVKKPGLYAVLPKNSEDQKLGNTGISIQDIITLNLLYQCKGQAENSTWSNWNEWSTCKEKDGKCQKTRQRFCTLHDISQCKNKFNISSEFDEDAMDCGGLQECKTDGEWNSWESWTSCSTSCGIGNQSRSRECNNPVPIYGGRHCVGDNTEKRLCRTDQWKNISTVWDFEHTTSKTFKEKWNDYSKSARYMFMRRRPRQAQNIDQTSLTPVFSTGPMYDHTQDTFLGYFMVVLSSPPAKLGDIAKLRSPLFTSNTSCVKFWYHMYGGDQGSLILLKKEKNSPIWNALLTIRGNQGKYWIPAEVNVATMSPFELEFQAVCGKGKFGDVGIDDISLTPGVCCREEKRQEELDIVND